jgi:predicted nucleic acid-binding protein
VSDARVDTDVLIRLLTGDDQGKQRAAATLFEEVEHGARTLAAPDTVIAYAVFVLSSPRIYSRPRTEVRDLLEALVRLPGFHVDNKAVVLEALDIFATSNLDFGDAMIVANMRRDGATVLYSYDRDFDRFPGLMRTEP